MDAVVTKGLRKSYGSLEVLHGIDLRVPAGSLYGFLGPNGAGKTTAIRVLLGLLRASGGSAEILGRDVWRQGAVVRTQVGYLPGDLHLYDYLTGRATLAFFDAARGAKSDAEIKRLAGVLDLDLDRRVRHYSRGMKQKLGLIQAMAHRPALLILDEPTISLDPLMREALLAELRRAAGEGRTVLFSSHTLSEVEQLCDRVGILREGCLIEQAQISTLRERAVRRVEVTFDARKAMPPPPPGLQLSHRDDARLTGCWIGPMQPLFAWLADGNVHDATVSPPDLEDLFLAYYSGQETIASDPRVGRLVPAPRGGRAAEEKA